MRPGPIGMDSRVENYFLAYGVGKCIPEGHLGAPPTVVTNEGLSLFFSDAPSKEFDDQHLRENLSNMEWLEKNVLDFHRQLDGLYRRVPILPFPFPTVYASLQAMRDVLRSHKEIFSENLNYFADKHEWGIKVFLSRAFFRRWLMSRLGVDLPEDPVPSPGARFFEKKRWEQETEERADSILGEILLEVRNRVENAVLECKEVEFLKGIPGLSASQEPVCSLAVLMGKDGFERLDLTVKQLTAAHKKKGVVLRLSGPWPPYNFVRVEE